MARQSVECTAGIAHVYPLIDDGRGAVDISRSRENPFYLQVTSDGIGSQFILCGIAAGSRLRRDCTSASRLGPA
jgi:hypothetical protein